MSRRFVVAVVTDGSFVFVDGGRLDSFAVVLH